MKIDRIGSFSVAYSHNHEASVENWVGEVDVKQKWSCREKTNLNGGGEKQKSPSHPNSKQEEK